MSKRDSKPMVAEDDPGWVAFWDKYPNRVSKKDARAAWTKLDPSPELVQAILTALEWQVVDWSKKADWYTPPYPAGYLRSERWTDSPPVVQQQIPKSLSGVHSWMLKRAVGD